MGYSYTGCIIHVKKGDELSDDRYSTFLEVYFANLSISKFACTEVVDTAGRSISEKEGEKLLPLSVRELLNDTLYYLYTVKELEILSEQLNNQESPQYKAAPILNTVIQIMKDLNSEYQYNDYLFVLTFS